MLWSAARGRLPEPREDRPGQPVFVLDEPPEPGETGLRAATPADLDRLLPACALAHQEELGVDPLARDAEAFRWRTRAQIEEGRSWIWLEDDVILFKAEASAWTPSAVQLQQVWVDPEVRRLGNAKRGAARPLPAAARADARGLSVRPSREPGCDPPLRDDRHAARPELPQPRVLMGVAPNGSPVDVYRALPGADEAELIASALPAGASILELGCGTGRVTHELVARGFRVTAVDESAEMLEHVRGAETVLSRIEELELARTFDAVLLASHFVNAPEPGGFPRRAVPVTSILAESFSSRHIPLSSSGRSAA